MSDRTLDMSLDFHLERESIHKSHWDFPKWPPVLLDASHCMQGVSGIRVRAIGSSQVLSPSTNPIWPEQGIFAWKDIQKTRIKVSVVRWKSGILRSLAFLCLGSILWHGVRHPIRFMLNISGTIHMASRDPSGCLRRCCIFAGRSASGRSLNRIFQGIGSSERGW